MDKSAFTSTVIGVFGGILGVCIGQVMGANAESDKFVREKIQESYYRVLGLPQLAEEFHSSALNKLTPQSFDFHVAAYERSREKYATEIKYIESISALYERRLSKQTSTVSTCSKSFTTLVANHMLLEIQASGRQLAGRLVSYKNSTEPLTWNESVQAMVDQRTACEKEVDKLKEEIADAMQNHL